MPRRLTIYPWCDSLDEFSARFGALDAEWSERQRELRDCDWSAVPQSVRAAWGDWLLASTDPIVREQAPRALATWGDGDRLAELLRDPRFIVRKSAAYEARYTGADARLAERLWAHLPTTYGTHAYETLESAIALSEPSAWIPRAAALLMEVEQDERVRLTAASALTKAVATQPLERALELLHAPPSPTWALHIALLHAARELELALPDGAHLARVDDLWLQEALA